MLEVKGTFERIESSLKLQVIGTEASETRKGDLSLGCQHKINEAQQVDV